MKTSFLFRSFIRIFVPKIETHQIINYMKFKNQMLAAAVAVALCGCGEQKPANP